MKKRKLWQSLRLRLIAWYSILAGLSMFVSNCFMYSLFQQTLLKQVDGTLKIVTIQAEQNLDDEVKTLKFDPRENASVLASLLEDSGVSVSFLDSNGLLTEQLGKLLVSPQSTNLQPGFQTIKENNERWRIYTHKISPLGSRPSGWLILGHSLGDVDASVSDLL